MPAVLPPATVLVTGVSGFSAAWIARALLQNGYAVRGSVRSEEKAAYVASLFISYADCFQPVIVPDISKANTLIHRNAFDAVLDESISAVVHVAGVAELSVTDSSDILGPNTDGVINLLEATFRNGKNVKRFVYMSSAQAMLGHKDLFHVYTEDDWADKDLALWKAEGNNAGGQTLYRASKVLAERAIIDFVNEHKNDMGWDATRILPAWIFGPVIHDWKVFSDLNLSSKIMYQQLTTPRMNDVNDYASDYIDVRDVADAFVAALKIEAAGNERFILDAGAYTYQNLSPNLPGVVVGNPDAPRFSFPYAFCDASKAKRVLQLKEFKTLGECAVDTFNSIQEKLL